MLQVYAQVGVYPVAHGHSYPGGRVDHLTAAGDHQQRMIVENLDPLAPQVSVVLQRPAQGGVLVAIAVDLFIRTWSSFSGRVSASAPNKP